MRNLYSLLQEWKLQTLFKSVEVIVESKAPQFLIEQGTDRHGIHTPA